MKIRYFSCFLMIFSSMLLQGTLHKTLITKKDFEHDPHYYFIVLPPAPPMPIEEFYTAAFDNNFTEMERLWPSMPPTILTDLKMLGRTGPRMGVLQLAALAGSDKAVRYLLGKGADRELELYKYGVVYTPQAIAGWLSPSVIAKFYQVSDLPNNDLVAVTPLMLAAFSGSQPTVDVLLQAGANAQAQTQSGLTAADFARAAGHDALARYIETGKTPTPSVDQLIEQLSHFTIELSALHELVRP